MTLARIRFSSDAEEDIHGIVAYTMSAWGWRQTDEYVGRLEEGIDLLGTNPAIGRKCDEIRTGLRRFEIGSHVVFYLVEADGILVVRVLHQQMLPSKNL